MPPTIYARPDGPGSAVTPTVPAGDDGWLQAAQDLIVGIPTGLWYALAASVVTAGLISSIRIARGAKKNPRSLKGDKFLTFLAAGVSTSVVATGMWKFFGDVLDITNPIARGALFAVFEIAMLASAFRSRRFRLDRAAKRDADPGHVDKRIDVDGIAVWALALISGLFAAADEHTTTAKAVRIVVPLLAAWMWERGLAGELMQFTRTGKRLNLRLTPERVLVWLGIAEPSSRDIDEVARRRRIARFARTAFRLHLLVEKPGHAGRVREMRIGWLRWRLRRQTESGNEHLNLAADQAALHDVRLQIALLYGAEEGTSRAAVRELTPLMPVKRLEITATPYSFAASSHDGSHGALTEARTDDALSEPAGSHEGTQAAKPAESAPANPAEIAAAKVAAKREEKPAASPAAAVAKPAYPLADHELESVRKLAKAFSRNRAKTNGELAKLAKVSTGTANRYMPTVRAAFAGSESADDSQERAHLTLTELPISQPSQPVTQGVNGHPFPSKENP